MTDTTHPPQPDHGRGADSPQPATAAARHHGDFLDAVLEGWFRHESADARPAAAEAVNVAHVHRYPPEVMHLLGGAEMLPPDAGQPGQPVELLPVHDPMAALAAVQLSHPLTENDFIN